MIVSDEVYRVKQGATGPPLTGVLPVTIVGANVVMRMVNVLNLDGPVRGGTCVNLDTGSAASKGRFSYDWQPADTATPGTYRMEFHVTFAPSTPDETVEVFPEDDYDLVEVVKAIGPVGTTAPPPALGAAVPDFTNPVERTVDAGLQTISSGDPSHQQVLTAQSGGWAFVRVQYDLTVASSGDQASAQVNLSLDPNGPYWFIDGALLMCVAGGDAYRITGHVSGWVPPGMEYGVDAGASVQGAAIANVAEIVEFPPIT